MEFIKNINIYEWFDKNSDNFTAFGRDIESFFQKLKYHMEEEYLRNLKMNVQL